jgi:hypothetical protein
VKNTEQLTEAQPSNAISVEAQEGEGAAAKEKGVLPAEPSKVPNVSCQDGAGTMMDVGQALRHGGGHFPRSKQGECNGQREKSVHGP